MIVERRKIMIPLKNLRGFPFPSPTLKNKSALAKMMAVGWRLDGGWMAAEATAAADAVLAEAT